ncbi:MAG: TlpA family protein disulfide reductase [Candidatus Rokubacteria bacterium]|nr:TlpA family protein disulfide reductase [Candidatus Rokubacteria bacterium]
MRARRMVVVIGVAALGTIGAGAAIVAGTRSPPGAATGEVAPPATRSPAATAAVTTTPTRAGRVLSVSDAMKELELIRPTRLKLADDFTVSTPEGKSFRLSAQRGKLVLVNFWATWCPPCREEMPAMERLYRQHRDRGFVMVAVSLDADPAVVRPFVAERGFTFSVGLDPKMQVANAYGVRALPSSFVIDRSGNLAALAIGPRTWDNEASHSLVEGMTR